MYLKQHMQKDSTDRVIYQCSHCGKCFLSGHSFRKHMREHNDKIFNCEYCVQSFETKDILLSHVNCDHKSAIKTFCCRIKGCSAIFPFHSLLKTHVSRHFKNERSQKYRRTHVTEKLFHCTHCSAQFRFEWLLTDHTQTHSGKKEFICDVQLENGSVCDKAFATKKVLQMHKRLHKNVQIFKCEWISCTKAFYTRTDLKRHMRHHTGERRE